MKLAPSGFGYLARSPSDGGLACTAILILPRKVYRQIATLIAWENSSSGCRFRSIWWSWNQPRSLFENAFFPKESFCLMQIEPTDAAALCAVLLKDLEAIRRIEKHIASLPARSPTREQLDSLGFARHNLYNALENSFAQISLTFENHVKDQIRWHRELLEKMFLEMPPVRPAILPVALKPLLNDLVGFRHFFRHSYEFSLDEAKTVRLAKRWKQGGRAVKGALERFCKRLATISAGH